MYAINLDSTDRIQFATPDWCKEPDSILVESLPTGQTAKEQDLMNWLYRNGQYIYDPLPDPEPQPEPIDLEKLDAQVLFTAMMTDTVLEDEE